MRGDGVIAHFRKLIFVFICVGFIFGCSEDSGSSIGASEPFPTQELSGVWLGDFFTENVDNFTVGIITRDKEARFIGSNIQYSGLQNALNVTPNTSVFSGNLDELSLDDPADDYSSTSVAVQVGGWIATQALLWGSFRYEDTQETGSLYFVYNTTYEVSPNVRNLAGSWIASNVFEDGNTLTLNIVPDPDIENTTSGTISGGDSLANIFSGDITIHYTTESEAEGNVYDVSLTFDGIELNGLATYVEEMTTEGIEIPKKTLALGVSNPDSTYMISVLSTLGD